MAPATGEFREGQFTNEHGTRRYRLYIPATTSHAAPPLIVMLHGCTQDPADFAAGTRANDHAEAAGALVLYPEQPATAHPQKCWNWYDPAHQGRGAGEPAILAGMTRQVMAETGADPARVFVAGISAGGSMAEILAAGYPELYRALAVHSALAYRSAGDVPTALTILQSGVADEAALPARVLDAMGEAARPIPTLVLHGAEDPVVRVVNGQQVLRQWAQVALQLGSHAHDGGSPAGSPADSPAAAPAETPVAAPAAAPADADCPIVPGLTATSSRVEADAPATRCVYHGAAVPLEYWVVHGSGHAWSGGSEAGTYTDPAGPDATARIFRFFLPPDEAGP